MITVIIIAGAFAFVKSFLKKFFEFFKVFCKEAFCRNQVPPSAQNHPSASRREPKRRMPQAAAAPDGIGNCTKCKRHGPPPHKRRAEEPGTRSALQKARSAWPPRWSTEPERAVSASIKKHPSRRTPEPENAGTGKRRSPESAGAGKRRGPPGPGNPSAQNHPSASRREPKHRMPQHIR